MILKGQQQIQDYVRSNPGAFDPSKLQNNSKFDYLGYAKQHANQQTEQNYSPGLGGFVERLGVALTQGPRAFGIGVPGAKTTEQNLLPNEQLRFRQDPNTFRTQSLINTASFAPVIANPILGGFVASAGQNLAGQDLGNKGFGSADYGSVLGSGIVGAATGYGLNKLGNYVGGKLLGKAANEATATETNTIDSVVGKINKADQMSSQELNKIGKIGNSLERRNIKLSAGDAGSPIARDVQQNELLSTLRSFGKKTGTQTELANGAYEVNNEIRSVLKPELKAVDAKLGVGYDGKALLEDISNNIGNKKYLLQPPEVQSYLKDLAKPNLTREVANDIKFEIQSKLASYYDKVGATGDTATTRVKEGLKVIRDVLDNKLKSDPALAAYAPVLKKSSFLNNIQEQLNKAVDKGGTKVGSPLIVSGIRADIGGATQRLESNVGKFLQGQSPIKLPSLRPNIGNAPLAGTAVASLGAMGRTNQPSMNDVSSSDTQGSSINNLKYTLPEQGQQGLSPQEALAYATQATGGKVTALTLQLAKYYQDATGGGGGGKILPAASVAKITEITSGINQLADLQNKFNNSKDVFNPITGELRKLNPWDTGAQNADAVIRLVRQIIGKGLEGGVLRKEDEYKYEQILPKISDTGEVVQSKINNLQQALVGKYNDNIDAYGQAGYDVSRFGTFQ